MAQQLGGAIIDAGKFDWMAHADKFPGSAHRMILITELPMQKNLEKKVLSSPNVPLS